MQYRPLLLFAKLSLKVATKGEIGLRWGPFVEERWQAGRQELEVDSHVPKGN